MPKVINTDDDLQDRPINWVTRGSTVWQGSFVYQGITFTIKFIGGKSGRWDLVFEQRIPLGAVTKIVGLLYAAIHQFIVSVKPEVIDVSKIKSISVKKIVSSVIKKAAKKTKPSSKPSLNTKMTNKEKKMKSPFNKTKEKNDSSWSLTKGGTTKRKVYK